MAIRLTLPLALRAALPAGVLMLVLAAGAAAQGTLSALQTDVDQIAVATTRACTGTVRASCARC